MLKGAVEAKIVGPKIVAPLGKAVGLVHSHQGNGNAGKGMEEVSVTEAFGGNVDDLGLAFAQFIEFIVLLGSS